MNGQHLFPHAIVIGPMRTGTTWLHDYLSARGDVCLPNGVKETHFFDIHAHKGAQWYQWHFRHFDSTIHRTIIEVAPSYFHCPKAPARILGTLGPVPLLVTLRNPVRRAWSHYLHLVSYGYTTAPIHASVLKFPEILDASRYFTMLTRWWSFFDSSQVHIFVYDDFANNQDRYAMSICELLELDPRKVSPGAIHPSNIAALAPSWWRAFMASQLGNYLRSKRLYWIINAAKRAGLRPLFYGHPRPRNLPEPSEMERNWLAAIFEPEIRRLQIQNGRDLSEWLKI